MAIMNRASDILAGRSTQKAPTISVAEMQSKRSVKNYLLWGLTGAAMLVGLIPWVGAAVSGAISIVAERIKNGTEAHKELKLRTGYYSEQIGATLGMDPRKVTIKDFAKAAEINPNLRRLYMEPIRRKDTENRTSLLINGGAAAAGSLIPWGNMGVHASKVFVDGVRGAGSGIYMAKSLAGSFAGGALGSALAHDKVNSQELIEALEKGLADADAKGIPRQQAINPQLIFILRVSQDELLEKQIKTQFGTALHKMKPEQINGVMASMPELAAAAQREAYAVAQGIAPIRDLAATAPNLQGNFAGPMVERGNGTHLQRLQAQRGVAVNDNATIASDNGAMSNAERIRMQQATRTADQGVAG